MLSFSSLISRSAAGMNWTCLVYGGPITFILIWWFVDARKWFKGPKYVSLVPPLWLYRNLLTSAGSILSTRCSAESRHQLKVLDTTARNLVRKVTRKETKGLVWIKPMEWPELILYVCFCNVHFEVFLYFNMTLFHVSDIGTVLS